MVKIHILGGSASGKSTLARELANYLHIPCFELDAIGRDEGRPCTEVDAFEISAQEAWIVEGVGLISTEALSYHADYIVFMQVSWPVALWRMVKRFVVNNLKGTNPYPHWKQLYWLIKGSLPYYLNRQLDPALVMLIEAYFAEKQGNIVAPTLESVANDVKNYWDLMFPPTQDFLQRYLARYQEKVVVIRNIQDKERFMKMLGKLAQPLAAAVGCDGSLPEAPQATTAVKAAATFPVGCTPNVAPPTRQGRAQPSWPNHRD